MNRLLATHVKSLPLPLPAPCHYSCPLLAFSLSRSLPRPLPAPGLKPCRPLLGQALEVQQSHEHETAEVAAFEEKLRHAHAALRKVQAAQPAQGGYYCAAAPTRGGTRSVSPGSTRTSPERVVVRDGSTSPVSGTGSNSMVGTSRGHAMPIQPRASADGLFEKTWQKARRLSAGAPESSSMESSPQSSMGDAPRAMRRAKGSRHGSGGHRRRAK